MVVDQDTQGAAEMMWTTAAVAAAAGVVVGVVARAGH